MIGISNACFRALLSALLVGLTADAALAQGPDPVRFGNAMELGDVRSARRWLDEGLPPDFEGERIGSGLMIGAWEGNIALMELFLQRGAHVNHISRFGEQALQLAAWRDHIDAVRWLLARGAVLQRPGKHWNALHYAAFAGHGFHGGMLFEELGVRYVGPIDGHNLGLLKQYLEMCQEAEGPVLLHIVTQKGHGFGPAEDDPVTYHTPAPFACDVPHIITSKKSGGRAYTNVASAAIHAQLTANPKVTVLTAAMCQGTNLEKARDDFPTRFFDVGICESHAVAFAAGQAKAGLRPIVDIYSTFLQRSYDQIFQEVALQNLPVTFVLDRAGLTGPERSTGIGRATEQAG